MNNEFIFSEDDINITWQSFRKFALAAIASNVANYVQPNKTI